MSIPSFFVVRNTGGLLACCLAVLGLVACQPPKLAEVRDDGEQSGVDEAALELVEISGDPITPDGEEEEVPSITYPVSRAVVSAEGAALEGVILAKRDDQLAFRRQADQRVFLLPLERLNQNEQEELSAWPDGEEAVIDALIAGETSDANHADVRHSSTENRSGRSGRRGNPQWHTSLDDALRESEQYGLPILAFFTGSDWCPPCKKMHGQILSSSSFRSFASDHVVLLKVDFPRRKKLPEKVQQANRDLSTRWGVNAFPTTILMDGKDQEYHRQRGLPKSATGYVEMLRQALTDSDRE